MRYLVTAIACLLYFSVYGQVEYLKIFYPDSTIKSEGKLIDNIKEGVWVEYHTNGQIMTESNFKNGDLDGLFKFYGIIDKPEELKRSYDGNDIIKSEGKYTKGNRTGMWRTDIRKGICVINQYDSNEKGDYIDFEIAYYTAECDNVAAEALWVNGNRHGRHVEYFRNGQMKFQNFYDNGVLILSKHFDEEGNEITYP
jgi:uncharacterized protein